MGWRIKHDKKTKQRCWSCKISRTPAEIGPAYGNCTSGIAGCENLVTSGDATETQPVDSNQEDAVPVYSIGDTGPAGGVIFYVDEAEEHDWTYLEMWTHDEGERIWKMDDSPTPGTVEDTGAGQANTELMSGEDHPAAEAARNASHGGYTDWFLPSSDELFEIWENIANDGSGVNSGEGNFADRRYWTSTEVGYDDKTAFVINFGSNGSLHRNNKANFNLPVRVVRAF